MDALLSAVLVLAPAGAFQEPERPEPARIEAAVERLEAAFGKGESADRIDAIRASADVVAPEVIRLVRKGLRDRDPTVQRAALEALGGMRHADAYEAVQKAYKRDKSLRKDEETYLALLRALGRQGDAGAVPLLAESVLFEAHRQHAQARIYGLGNIRSRESVEALMGVLKSGNRHRVQEKMEDLRMALMVLTGADEGRSQDSWMRWWNNSKKTLKVSAKVPPLPRAQKLRWDAYWGRGNREVRNRRRERRGEDGRGV